MDNYSTLLMVMEILREFMIWVVVTARLNPGKPGKNIKEIDDSQINFNEIFWSVNSFGTSLPRSMENGLVLLVMTVHTMIDVSEFLSRTPIVNQKNKIHMEKVWGKGKFHVWIS